MIKINFNVEKVTSHLRDGDHVFNLLKQTRLIIWPKNIT